ncbi:hypothetical protein HYPDE_41198 [Hyphomicrobium denitrificans 1NES1]|uniref:DUF4279 domain-containing protein n=1 Tax=Hyphomicrobium denitrificans 1NES1 TaxID=670307 RepID=N0BA68_9HYPH|nr:DUF4279 domain-containing protein [Hyphomicrobium denitrificans]AGK59908.1 hypothetical protein HYPDE_41198 [Hyphomicrobium denitrificans 1NES1]
MAEVHETAASLRFHGDDLDPEEISRVLGAQPTRCRKKGGIWITPSGKEKIARTGSWNFAAKKEPPCDLDKQINRIFSDLSDDINAWKVIASRYRGNIFVGLFLSSLNEGLTLSPTTLSAIGSRGLVLGFDIYSGDGKE